jgi:hypothetical protein
VVTLGSVKGSTRSSTTSRPPDTSCGTKLFDSRSKDTHHYPGNLDDVQVAMAFDVLCLAS